MYRIERVGFWRSWRLIADRKLTSAEFNAIAGDMGAPPLTARKVAPVAAEHATSEQVVVTRFNGEETRNTAATGDWIVTNLNLSSEPLRDREGNLNRYVITAAKFVELYEPAAVVAETPYGRIFRPRNVSAVEALRLSAGFDIVAPWGERQTGESGYLLKNGEDIYGNQTDSFESTYEIEG